MTEITDRFDELRSDIEMLHKLAEKEIEGDSVVADITLFDDGDYGIELKHNDGNWRKGTKTVEMLELLRYETQEDTLKYCRRRGDIHREIGKLVNIRTIEEYDIELQ